MPVSGHVKHCVVGRNRIDRLLGKGDRRHIGLEESAVGNGVGRQRKSLTGEIEAETPRGKVGQRPGSVAAAHVEDHWLRR